MLRRLLSILSIVVALVGFTALVNAQETSLGGQIGFAGSFTYDNNPTTTFTVASQMTLI